MEKHGNLPGSFEPRHDELPPSPDYNFALDRRKFFKLTGGGLAVAFVLHDLFSFAGERDLPEPLTVPVSQVGAWIHISESGEVNVFTGKVEVGQNIRTSLAQIVAEELKVPVASITMVMGDTDQVPYDSGTFGSLTTPRMGTQLRKAAATARTALLEMAAKNLDIPVAELKAENGMVTNKNGSKKISFGALTKGQQLLLPISENVEVIDASNWKIAGRTIEKINGRSFITGKHPYVSDMKLPGMLYGKVLRPPSYGAVLKAVDVTKAKALDGVTVVQDGNFIAVAAPDLRTAGKAIQVMNAAWNENPEQPSSANVFEYFVKNASENNGGRNAGSTKGNPDEELTKARLKHSKAYNIHYIAHVPLEPRAALAVWENEKLTVWVGTQRPFGVRDELSKIFRIDKENVRVIMPDTGSGYGGKHSGEVAIEAARLAKQAGKPVKIVWTREEEFTWAYFRPGGVIEVEGAIDNEGAITAWKFNNYNSGGSGLGTQYKIPNQQIAHLPSNSPLKQGSYRGLASTANVFARESHITDLARKIKMDQLAFRLKNIEDDRLLAVLQSAAKSFGWNGAKKEGHGFGIACGFEKGGYVATCAEVMVNSDKEVKVLRVTQAFECGAIINPHHLEHQVIGSMVQGLGGALFESVQFKEGRILNPNLSSYRVPRFKDMPVIEVVLLDRKDLPSSGAGEAAIIGIAPAIRNAIVDATGIELSTLPMLPNGVLA